MCVATGPIRPPPRVWVWNLLSHLDVSACVYSPLSCVSGYVYVRNTAYSKYCTKSSAKKRAHVRSHWGPPIMRNRIDAPREDETRMETRRPRGQLLAARDGRVTYHALERRDAPAAPLAARAKYNRFNVYRKVTQCGRGCACALVSRFGPARPAPPGVFERYSTFHHHHHHHHLCMRSEPPVNQRDREGVSTSSKRRALVGASPILRVRSPWNGGRRRQRRDCPVAQGHVATASRPHSAALWLNGRGNLQRFDGRSSNSDRRRGRCARPVGQRR